MTLLDPTVRHDLAQVINSILAAEMMYTDFRQQLNANPEAAELHQVIDGMGRWLLERYRSEIDLADRFGIELPALHIARAALAADCRETYGG